jgi:hypothetical protein
MTAIARCFAGVLLVLLVLCRAAHADPFTVTGGSITILDVRFSGAGFTLTGDDFSLSGGIEQFLRGGDNCLPCGPARPSITIGGPLGGITFGGGNPGRFAGVDYPHLFFTGSLFVHTSSFPLSMLLTSTTLTLPFDFTGRLNGYPTYDDAFNGPNQLFGADFVGRGTATLDFFTEPHPELGPLFDLRDATFVFSPSSAAPTPEPATVGLLGLGLIGLLGRGRQNIRASRRLD